MRCPSLNHLFDYVRSQLSADENTAVQKHLSAGCRSCQENQRWLQEAIQLVAQDQSYTLPEELIRQVVARLNPQSATPISSFRQLFAQLIFDSFMPGQLAELRSVPGARGPVVRRQLLFRAEGYDIDIQFEQVEGTEGEEMVGQILPQLSGSEKNRPVEIALFPVRLLQRGVEIGWTETNARGVFRFAQVKSGVYDIKIRVPEGEINIDAVKTARAS